MIACADLIARRFDSRCVNLEVRNTGARTHFQCSYLRCVNPVKKLMPLNRRSCGGGTDCDDHFLRRQRQK